MKSSRINSAKKSKRGRPPVESEAINVRMTADALKLLDDWRRLQDDLPGRPEAIRRLVEIGLAVGAKQKQTTAATADRAKELASKALDSLTAGAANNDEKASRKRRLITGPEEFREVRVDRPKAKRK
jgi:hypothetical protein